MAIEGFSQSLPRDLEQAVDDARAKWEGAANTSIVNRQLADVSKFKALAAEIAEDGFQHFVLLGTGVSVLCAEAFSSMFGKQANAPDLMALDSTDPAQIKVLRAKIDPERTLFCVASNSGRTVETNLLLQYFFDETKQAGHHFIGVTNAGSPLDEKARELGFRQVFHEADESALSDYGLVPFAAAGLDTEQLLKRAAAVADWGIALGLVLGTAARKFGRDKVTLCCSQATRSLGAWIEQLLIPGLIAVHAEPVPSPECYGKDRVFVFPRLSSESEAEFDNKSGAPVIQLVLKDFYDLGRSFLQWEIAMEVAGSILGVHPFEQPAEPAADLAAEEPFLEQDGIQLFADQGNAGRLLSGGHSTLGGVIRSHIDRLKPGGYFGLLAYVPAFPEYEAKLQKIRKEILIAKQVATVLGFGPRFQHGAGGTYKAGPNSGVFLQITNADGEDLPVFAAAKAAQARADLQLLAERQRRVLRIHFSQDLSTGLDHLHNLVCASLAH